MQELILPFERILKEIPLNPFSIHKTELNPQKRYHYDSQSFWKHRNMLSITKITESSSTKNHNHVKYHSVIRSKHVSMHSKRSPRNVPTSNCLHLTESGYLGVVERISAKYIRHDASTRGSGRSPRFLTLLYPNKTQTPNSFPFFIQN